MAGIRVADHGILAHDDHGLELALLQAVHHLHGRQAAERRQGASPGRLELQAGLLVIHELVAGIIVGQPAHIAGALHVVLAAQRVHTGTGTTDLTAEHGQVGQGTDIVHAAAVAG